MPEWSVTLESKSSEQLAPGDPRIDHLIDLLTPHGGVVAYGGSGNVVVATMSAEGHDALAASQRALEILSPLLGEVGLSVWPVSRLEAVEAGVLSAELKESNFPDIVGATEVAEMLGVSLQRLRRLRKKGRFPEPILTLAVTPIWLRATIEAFLERWPRRRSWNGAS